MMKMGHECALHGGIPVKKYPVTVHLALCFAQPQWQMKDIQWLPGHTAFRESRDLKEFMDLTGHQVQLPGPISLKSHSGSHGSSPHGNGSLLLIMVWIPR